MSQDRFEAIMTLLKTLGLIAGGVIVLVKWAQAWQTSLSEKSLGATKVKELEKTATEVQNDIAELKRNDGTQQRQIEKLEDDYTRLIDHVWDLFGRNKLQ